ncbi:MAG: PilZ domain-containing protein [Rhizobiaceae bacterium]|nr:PilZ domain-containing protein [Rhizobiaceae bacterium]
MQKETVFIFDERRATDREPVDMLAEGVVPNLNESISCKLLDMSDSGVKVELLNADIIPDKIKLYIPEMDSLMECKIVRRNGRELGLHIENRVQFG